MSGLPKKSFLIVSSSLEKPRHSGNFLAGSLRVPYSKGAVLFGTESIERRLDTGLGLAGMTNFVATFEIEQSFLVYSQTGVV